MNPFNGGNPQIATEANKNNIEVAGIFLTKPPSSFYVTGMALIINRPCTIKQQGFKKTMIVT